MALLDAFSQAQQPSAVYEKLTLGMNLSQHEQFAMRLKGKQVLNITDDAFSSFLQSQALKELDTQGVLSTLPESEVQNFLHQVAVRTYAAIKDGKSQSEIYNALIQDLKSESARAKLVKFQNDEKPAVDAPKDANFLAGLAKAKLTPLLTALGILTGDMNPVVESPKTELAYTQAPDASTVKPEPVKTTLPATLKQNRGSTEKMLAEKGGNPVVQVAQAVPVPPVLEEIKPVQKPPVDIRGAGIASPVALAGNYPQGMRGGSSASALDSRTTLSVTPNANGFGMTIKGPQTSLVSTLEGSVNGDALTRLSLGQEFDSGFRFGASTELFMSPKQDGSGGNELRAFHLTATPGVRVGQNAAFNMNAMAARVDPAASYRGAKTAFDTFVAKGSQLSPSSNSVDIVGTGAGASYKGLSAQANFLSATEQESQMRGIPSNRGKNGSRGIVHGATNLNGYLAGTPFQAGVEGLQFQDGGADLMTAHLHLPGVSLTGNRGNMTLKDGTRVQTQGGTLATSFVPWDGLAYAGIDTTNIQGENSRNTYKTGARFNIGEETALLTEARTGEKTGGSVGFDLNGVQITADADHTAGSKWEPEGYAGMLRVRIGGGTSSFTPRTNVSALADAPDVAIGSNERRVERGLEVVDWKNRIHGYDAQFDSMVASLSFLNDVPVAQNTVDALQTLTNGLKGAEQKAVQAIVTVIKQGSKITKEDHSAWHSNPAITTKTKDNLDAVYFGNSPMKAMYATYNQDRADLERALESNDKGKLETELQTARSHLAQMRRDIESIKVPEMPAGTEKLMPENNRVYPMVAILRTAAILPAFIQFIQSKNQDAATLQSYKEIFESAYQSIGATGKQSPDFSESLRLAPKNQFDQMFAGSLPSGFEAHRATLNALVAGSNILKTEHRHLQALRQSFITKDIPLVGNDVVKTNSARSAEVQTALNAFLQNPIAEHATKLSESYYTQFKSSPYFVRTSFIHVQHSNDKVYQGANMEIATFDLRNKAIEQDRQRLLQGYYAWEKVLNPESQGPGILGAPALTPEELRNGALVLGGLAVVGGAIALATSGGGHKDTSQTSSESCNGATLNWGLSDGSTVTRNSAFAAATLHCSTNVITYTQTGLPGGNALSSATRTFVGTGAGLPAVVNLTATERTSGGAFVSAKTVSITVNP